MDKYEVLHIFKTCFLAYLHAEVGSAERDLFGSMLKQGVGMRK